MKYCCYPEGLFVSRCQDPELEQFSGHVRTLELTESAERFLALSLTTPAPGILHNHCTEILHPDQRTPHQIDLRYSIY